MKNKYFFTWMDRMDRIKPKRSFYIFVFILSILSIHVKCLFAFEIVEGKESGRNPFALPKGVFLRSKLNSAAEREKKEKQIVLEAIITSSANKRRASISGTIVEEGDDFSGKKVLEIGKDFVVLEGDIENMRLKLKRPPFSIGITEETGVSKKSEETDPIPEKDDQKPTVEKNKVLSWIENLKKSK